MFRAGGGAAERPCCRGAACRLGEVSVRRALGAKGHAWPPCSPCGLQTKGSHWRVLIRGITWSDSVYDLPSCWVESGAQGQAGHQEDVPRGRC